MLEEQGGWFVVNVKDANWRESKDFGSGAHFEMQGPFADVGINLRVLSPGKPLCRYHRENAQEDFLVLSGVCTLLVNGEKKPLRAWDFVHCPPGVTHVLVGAGEGPCVVIGIGHRKGEAHKLFYPASDLARPYGAEAPEPTDRPAVAYSDVEAPGSLEDVEWPLG